MGVVSGPVRFRLHQGHNFSRTEVWIAPFESSPRDVQNALNKRFGSVRFGSVLIWDGPVPAVRFFLTGPPVRFAGSAGSVPNPPVKIIVKLLENIGKLLEIYWKIIGKLLENYWKIIGNLL